MFIQFWENKFFLDIWGFQDTSNTRKWVNEHRSVLKYMRMWMSEIDAVVRCILEAEQSSNDGKEVTPVPMPNTEVKLFSANGSWGLSPCESRTLLGD